MVYKFFDKKDGDIQLTDTGAGIRKSGNRKLGNELHKPIIRKFNKRKIYTSYRGSIWGADLVDMQLIEKCNRRTIKLKPADVDPHILNMVLSVRTTLKNDQKKSF